MTSKGEKLLALALDPAAAIGEMQSAAIKFVELCRREGYKAKDIKVNGTSGYGPSAGWVGEKFNLLREVSHWRARTEAAEKSVGTHAMRVKFLEERCNALVQDVDRLKLTAPKAGTAKTQTLLDLYVGQSRLTFGKHNGKLVAEVPSPYLRWCLANRRDLTERCRKEFSHTIIARDLDPSLEPHA